MKVNEKKWIRFRILTVLVVFLLGLATMLARAYQLQVMDQGRLKKMARAGYIGTLELPPKRGTIYDRGKHELAISVEVQSVYAHPKRIKDKTKTARALSLALGEDRKGILSDLKKDRPFVWIKRRIPPETAEKMLKLELEGVGTTMETRRYYPAKELAAHLIGFSGVDNQGLEGLEKKYDAVLTLSLIHI